MKKITFLIIFLFTSLGIYSQEYTLSGIVEVKTSAEPVAFANVYIVELQKGAQTDLNGKFSIKLPEGEYTLKISFVGYDDYEESLKINGDKKMTFKMKAGKMLDEVEVLGEKDDDKLKDPTAGMVKMDVKDMEKIPVVFGEQDVIKTIQLMPGISSAGEGSSGFYVRGGSADQNLVLVDDAPVFNPAHLLGFFSVFNSNALSTVELYKGGISPKYGGRISSVLDVSMKEGDMKKWGFDGGIGLISSRFTTGGPLKKDKASIIISGRRTYADLFLGLSKDPTFSSSKAYFYDLNAKIAYKIGKKDKLTLSGYFGKDVMKYSDIFAFNYGNATATAKWNHVFNSDFFMNSSFIFSDYVYNIQIQSPSGTDFKIKSGIRDYQIKTDFVKKIGSWNTLVFGGGAIFHHFRPGEIDALSDQINDINIQERYGWESNVYIGDQMRIGTRLNIDFGIRLSMYNCFGPAEEYLWDDQGEVTDTLFREKNKAYKTYLGWEPRFNLSFMINETMSIKAGYNRNYQYMTLLSQTGSGQPTDVWVSASSSVKPQIGDQVSLGYFVNFGKNSMFEASVEVFYKYMQNQLDYRNGSQILFNQQIEASLLQGIGYSYGAEFFIKKRKGWFQGWIGYTLMRSIRKVPGINNNEEYSARQDRIHDINLVLMFDITDRLTLSSTFVYNTGDAVTWPAGKYEVDGQLVPYYPSRNAARMPDYHRMDLALILKDKKFKMKKNKETGEKEKIEKRFRSTWAFSIYNVYARQNAYTVSFEENPDNPGQFQAKQLALFRIVPSVTWNFKF
ncbi:MAG: TonB-dependent receptor [Crocinitomicaceae bacterium]|nr:TonB-dependent receptor [Crocinitomicaceae bacterium]